MNTRPSRRWPERGTPEPQARTLPALARRRVQSTGPILLLLFHAKSFDRASGYPCRRPVLSESRSRPTPRRCRLDFGRCDARVISVSFLDDVFVQRENANVPFRTMAPSIQKVDWTLIPLPSDFSVSAASATEVKRSIPPRRISSPSPRKRSRTEERASTA